MSVEIVHFETPVFIGNPPPPDLLIVGVFDAVVGSERLRGLDLWKTASGFEVSYPEGKKLVSPHYREILDAAVQEYTSRTKRRT